MSCAAKGKKQCKFQIKLLGAFTHLFNYYVHYIRKKFTSKISCFYLNTEPLTVYVDLKIVFSTLRNAFRTIRGGPIHLVSFLQFDLVTRNILHFDQMRHIIIY